MEIERGPVSIQEGSEWKGKEGSPRVGFQQTPLVAGNPCMFTRVMFYAGYLFYLLIF